MAKRHDALDEILEKIRAARNFDFRSYKRPTLRRRIEQRMEARRCGSMDAYVDLLDRSPDEYDALVSALLVRVTSFFRDRDTWELLGRKVIPALVARNGRKGLRAWSVGCATGEEAYSVAMLLADALGTASAGAKVFGTDVDEGALAIARRGIYSSESVEHLPGDVVSRHFTRVPEGFTVHRDIRRMVVFGVNNVVSDAPISRLDLVICRNLFIYLDAPLQARILRRFHYALRPRGVLILGQAELIPYAASLLRPVDLHHRVYERSADDHLAAASEPGDEPPPPAAAPAPLERAALHALGVPLVATALDGAVTLWNAAAEKLWHRSAAEVAGKRLAALGLPGLTGDLLVEKSGAVRGGAERAIAEAAVVEHAADAVKLSVEVTAIRDGGAVTGLLYAAMDVTARKQAEEAAARAHADRVKAAEELQTVTEEMQSSNEELETTNEELQSANEELQTTNEELQSTNEELETTNEELQSTNAELDSTNRELAARTEELSSLSLHHRAIIRSLSAAVAVLRPDGRITLWNLAAERIFGLTEAEAVGQIFWNLRLPIVGKAIARQIRARLARKLALRVDDLTYDRSSRATGHAALSAIPLLDDGRVVGGLVLLEDTTQAVALAEGRLRAAGAPITRPSAPPARRRRARARRGRARPGT